MKHPPLLILNNVRALHFYAIVYKIKCFIKEKGFGTIEINVSKEMGLDWSDNPLVNYYFILNELNAKIDIYEGKFGNIERGRVFAETVEGYCHLIELYLWNKKAKK